MCLMTHLRNFYYHPDTAQDKRTKKQTAQFTVCFLSDRKPVYFFIT